MDNNQGSLSCVVGCWAVAALGGALATVLLWVLGGWSFMQGVFAGAIVFGAAGALVSWIMCRPLPAPGTGMSSTAGAPTAEAKSASAVKEAPVAKASPAAQPADAAVKSSTTLPGEAELAGRKGEWKYEGGAKAPAKKAKAPAKKKADAAPAADTGPGTKPATLTAARDGGPDNLKEIKGVGPKLEALLHSMGFYHFDQIADWGPEEVAWVDQNLQGFKGRVSRDDWVDQAKILASGGETEFSKKVDKGDVY